MIHSVSMIGLLPEELPSIRSLVALLRHPDPTVPELARQALLYLSRSSCCPSGSTEPSPNSPMLNCMK